MDKKAELQAELHRKRMRRRLRASIFLRRNGLYIAVAVCLAVIGGAAALIFGGNGNTPETPAEHSYDQRLNEAQASIVPAATPLPTRRPSATSEPLRSPKPTLIPNLTPAPSAAPEPASVSWISPVDGRLIRVYSMDALIYSKTLGQWMTHSGVDVAAPKGTEVHAVDAGTVARVYDDDMLGTTVIIEHADGLTTVYCGLKKEPPVREGDAVDARALIGYIGDTAISECAEESHLHFEIRLNGRPVDPRSYITFKTEA